MKTGDRHFYTHTYKPADIHTKIPPDQILGPNGSWCITEEASAPEGMTHACTDANTLTLGRTQAGFRPTGGCFLWFQNIRSWPGPKSHGCYQRGSEAIFLFFLFCDRYFWSGLWCDAFNAVCLWPDVLSVCPDLTVRASTSAGSTT